MPSPDPSENVEPRPEDLNAGPEAVEVGQDVVEDVEVGQDVVEDVEVGQDVVEKEQDIVEDIELESEEEEPGSEDNPGSEDDLRYACTICLKRKFKSLKGQRRHELFCQTRICKVCKKRFPSAEIQAHSKICKQSKRSSSFVQSPPLPRRTPVSARGKDRRMPTSDRRTPTSARGKNRRTPTSDRRTPTSARGKNSRTPTSASGQDRQPRVNRRLFPTTRSPPTSEMDNVFILDESSDGTRLLQKRLKEIKERLQVRLDAIEKRLFEKLQSELRSELKSVKQEMFEELDDLGKN